MAQTLPGGADTSTFGVIYRQVALAAGASLYDTVAMSKDAVLVVFALTALGAWYGRHLVQTIADVTAAKGRLEAARRARRGAWKVALPVGLVIYVAVRSWMHRNGGG